MKYRRLKPVDLIVMLLLSLLMYTNDSFSASNKAKEKSESMQPAYSIASYNINYGNPDLRGIVANLRQADADIIALQETNRTSQRFLLQQLRRKYPYSSFHHAPAAGGFGFLSRYPLKNAKHIPLKYGWFGVYVADVTTPDGIIHIANLHLQPSIPEIGESLVHYFMRWKKTEIIRIREIQQVLKETPKEQRRSLILTGDFNSLPNTLVTHTLKNHGYIDSYASVTDENDRKTTWQWQVGDYVYQFRLDYLFHGPEWETCSSDIFPSNASDHHLILNTLQRHDTGE